MLFSLNLLETFSFNIINILFFFIFFSVLVLGYPMGRYLLINYCDNSLIKNSIFSIVIFAVLIAIIINVAPIFAKYLIVIFYLSNLLTLIMNSKIRNDLIQAIISFKFILLATFITFLILNLIYKPISIRNDELIFLFDSHYAYFINPISEIFTSDYFSRFKMLSLYPLEWSSTHFFNASFNSIFLSPIYLSGTMGLIGLKNFAISIVLSLFCFSFFKDKNFDKEEYFLTTLKIFLIILLFIFLIYFKVYFLITSNNLVSTLIIIFIVQSLFSKSKDDLLIWLIIFTLSSFSHFFISLMLAVYYLIDSQNFNSDILIYKIKKNLNLPNLLLIILFLFYFIATFYNSEFTQPKYNLPGNLEWWQSSINYLIIENYKFFLSILILLIIAYLFSSKYFFKKKLNLFLKLNRQDLFYFSLVLIIPFICITLFIFKNQIFHVYNIVKLKIFFDSLNIINLYFYFFVPLIWCLILFSCKILARNIFVITIIIYTFLSIFIYNPIILMAFYSLEIMILFFISYILFDFKVDNKKQTFSYLFIVSVIILSSFNFNINHEAVAGSKNKAKLVFKIKDLKELRKEKHICPADIKHIDSHKYTGDALSAILVMPYYSDISITETYTYWDNISLRFAVSSKQQVNNPCINE